jgi:hypothetical protein
LIPNIKKSDMTVEQRDGKTIVNGTFHNYEDYDIDATVTASLSSHSNSTEFTFAAGEDTKVSVEIPYTGSFNSMLEVVSRTSMSIDVGEVTCPYCDGTGETSGEIECPTCGGLGWVDEDALANLPTGSGGSRTPRGSTVTSDDAFPWVTVGAAIAVVAAAGGGTGAFILFKKRRVNERSLRKLTSSEFNQWVLKRLDGKDATSRDTASGINGYTHSGQPLLIKQMDNVGMMVIDSFAAALARSKARSGVVVAYSYGSDAVRGKVRAQMNYRLQIELLTVQDLINSKRLL